MTSNYDDHRRCVSFAWHSDSSTHHHSYNADAFVDSHQSHPHSRTANSSHRPCDTVVWHRSYSGLTYQRAFHTIHILSVPPPVSCCLPVSIAAPVFGLSHSPSVVFVTFF